jgi:hypothetical protein
MPEPWLRQNAREKCNMRRSQFDVNRIMLKGIRTGFTFRFREW